MIKMFSPPLARLMAGVFLLLLAPQVTWAQSWQWARGADAVSGSQGTRTVTDAAGNSYVMGFFSGAITFGGTTLNTPGDDDVFLVKLTSQGTYQWAIQAGGTGTDHGIGLALGPDGHLVVTGRYSGATAQFGATTLTNSSTSAEVFVAKLDTAGTWLWARSAGGRGSDEAADLAIDPTTGNVVIAGGFYGTPASSSTFGTTALTCQGAADVFVAALSASGNWLWAVRAGGTDAENVRFVTIDSTGDVLVSGSFRTNARFGNTLLTGLGGNDLFVAKLSAAGAWQWAVRGGGDGDDYDMDLVLAPGGGAIVLGRSSAGTGRFGTITLPNTGAITYMFVAALDATGAWQRAQRTPSIYGGGLARDPSGDLIVLGTFRNAVQLGATTLTSVGGFDLFVGRLTPAGTWSWAVSAGGAGDEGTYAVALDNHGGMVITGRYNSDTLAFSGGIRLLRPTPFDNVYIARLGLVTGTSAETAPPTPFTLTPNPAHHTVQLSGAPSPTATLLDATGRVVLTSDLSLPTSDLDLKGLPPGLYLVRCGPATRRLVVE